jgi:hypothetical protein
MGQLRDRCSGANSSIQCPTALTSDHPLLHRTEMSGGRHPYARAVVRTCCELPALPVLRLLSLVALCAAGETENASA